MTNKREFFSECRKKKGSQKEVAKDMGKSEVYIRLIENGTFPPGRDLMFRFQDYFGEPMQKLFPDLWRRDNTVEEHINR